MINQDIEIKRIVMLLVVYKVGLICQDGSSLVHIDIREDSKTSDPTLYSGFLTALKNFIKLAFSDETLTFEMSKYKVYFEKLPLIDKSSSESSEVSIFVLADKKDTDDQLVKKMMKKASKEITQVFPEIDKGFISDKEKIEKIKQLLMNEFEDLAKKPSERVRSLF